MTYQVLTQDAFCFVGCLPEGYGPESNGDTFETKEDAMADAVAMLRAMLADNNLEEHAIESAVVELRECGEFGADLPFIDEETGEESSDGTRFISIAVVEVES
jgi:hypothetical protein